MLETLVISNTSPLLYLNLVRQLDLLPALYHIVAIPPTVRDELAVGKKQGVLVPEMDHLEWLHVVPVGRRPK